MSDLDKAATAYGTGGAGQFLVAVYQGEVLLYANVCCVSAGKITKAVSQITTVVNRGEGVSQDGITRVWRLAKTVRSEETEAYWLELAMTLINTLLEKTLGKAVDRDGLAYVDARQSDLYTVDHYLEFLRNQV